MKKFKVGDTVKVLHKSIGGNFEDWFKNRSNNTLIHVITDVFENGEVHINGDWFLESDLVLTDKLLKLKIGDRIIKVKNMELSNTNHVAKIGSCGNIIGYINGMYKIKYDNYISSNGYFVGNDSSIELFIKPKFKVGDKFITRAGGVQIEVEIVKVSLNKKFKQYAYLVFDTSSGKVGALVDNELSNLKRFTKVIKPKEMTVDEISKKLGYKVIVKQ